MSSIIFERKVVIEGLLRSNHQAGRFTPALEEIPSIVPPCDRRHCYGEAVQSNDRLRSNRKPMPIIGYMRVSKADGSQVLDLQRDALTAAGVPERNLYSDAASGK